MSKGWERSLIIFSTTVLASLMVASCPVGGTAQAVFSLFSFKMIPVGIGGQTFVLF